MTEKEQNAEEQSRRTPDLDSIKKMVRLLEWKRRTFLEKDWKEHPTNLQRSQFNQLMLVRFQMPCNLGKIMAVTGLTSAGASLFVDKLVQAGFLLRKDDPTDRRNVKISLTKYGREYLKSVDDRLNQYIFQFFNVCTEDELKDIDKAMKAICTTLDPKGEALEKK